MVSFDVTSLFTNVPLTFTIDYILDQMYPTCVKTCMNLPRTKQCVDCKWRIDFEALLWTATSDTHFSFNLMNTNASFVLIERKTKNRKSLSLAFSDFQSAVYVYIYHQDDIYERFCIRSFVFKHMFIDAIEERWASQVKKHIYRELLFISFFIFHSKYKYIYKVNF